MLALVGSKAHWSRGLATRESRSREGERVERQPIARCHERQIAGVEVRLLRGERRFGGFRRRSLVVADVIDPFLDFFADLLAYSFCRF